MGCDTNIYIDENDKQNVIFAYPNLFPNPSTLKVIRLEIGALAAWTPAKLASIEPYTAVYLSLIHIYWTIAPCGNTALNLLGLSTQVAAVWSYIRYAVKGT